MITLVTGGGQGIGFATAQKLVADGGRVCILDLTGAAEAARRLGPGKAIGVTGDVTSEAAVDAAIARTLEAFGGLDALVTSAGIVRVEPALEASAETFARTLMVNVLGSFLPSQRAARVMSRSGGGAIVLVGSVYGAGGAPNRTAYCASKGAVHNLTRSLAVEWGPLGIRVNAVAATGTRTPMVQDLIDRGVYDLAGVTGRTPLGRLAEPEEIASAIAYLLSDAARMVTGTILPVDGGWIANGFTARRTPA